MRTMIVTVAIVLASFAAGSHQQQQQQLKLQCLEDFGELFWDPEGDCVLENVNHQNFDQLNENLMVLNATSLELVNASFAQFGSSHFQGLPLNVSALFLRNGNVSEVYYLSDTLTSLSIVDTNLQRFFVDDRENEVLNTLTIRSSVLSEIPFRIGYLKGLKKLSLRGCNLTTVNMSMFAGITNLTSLHLAENRITTIEIDAKVFLAELKELFIEDNFLREINNFPTAFPNLRTLGLFNNRWFCDWVTEMRSRFIAAWIVVHGADPQHCDKQSTNNGGLCCYTRRTTLT